MRKILLFLFCCNYIFLFSQVEESTSSKKFFIGGDFSFFNQNNNVPFQAGRIFYNSLSPTEESSSQSMSFSGYLGNQISKNLAIGVSLDFFNSTSNFVEVFAGDPGIYKFDYNSSIFGVNLFGRYVFFPDKKFNFFLNPNVGYNLTNAKSSTNSSSVENKATYISAGVGLGILYNINDRWRVTASLGGISYLSGSWAAVSTRPKEKFNQFQTQLNLSNTFFGLEYRF
jgi:hypothetical protein